VFDINFSDENSSSSSETVEETGKEKEHSDLNNHDKKVLGRMLSDSQLIMRGNGKTGQEKLDHSKVQEKHQNSNILTNHVEWHKHKHDNLQIVHHQQQHLNELEVKNVQNANEHQSHIHGHSSTNKANELTSHENKNNLSGDSVSDEEKVMLIFLELSTDANLIC
jgi:hypothetical protein